PVFEVQSFNSTEILSVRQDAGNRVLIRGGSGFWGTAALEVSAAFADTTALKLKAVSGQTADVLAVQNSANQTTFAVGASGGFYAAGSSKVGSCGVEIWSGRFVVCGGTAELVSGAYVGSTLTVDGNIAYNNPNSLSGIYMC